MWEQYVYWCSSSLPYSCKHINIIKYIKLIFYSQFSYHHYFLKCK